MPKRSLRHPSGARTRTTLSHHRADAPGRRVSRALAALAVAGAALLSLGCETLMAMDRKDDFEVAQNYFTQYVRYGRISHAAIYVDPDQRSAFLSLEPDLTNLRFTDYDKVHVDMDDEAKEVTVTMRFSGYIQPEMIERHVDFEQTWRHDEEEGWVVRLEIDKIRRVLSGEKP